MAMQGFEFMGKAWKTLYLLDLSATPMAAMSTSTAIRSIARPDRPLLLRALLFNLGCDGGLGEHSSIRSALTGYPTSRPSCGAAASARRTASRVRDDRAARGDSAGHKWIAADGEYLPGRVARLAGCASTRRNTIYPLPGDVCDCIWSDKPVSSADE